ncbi:hypothetical protein [Aporhodopirellula aestuarii]|uniref:Uncharacterized protein n=1 Tax=Aporhodopirellula aestuarii TaxID=2950107 RepID=A0ABT0UEC7_9BACT|nr:hypothetical protein [Aporhodopirellula aestuarii]MCM2375255.1 hypothetical protein [Aporhodopirellula aestuarii]
MNLRHFVQTIATHDDELTIFVAVGQLSETSEIALVNLDENEEPDGMTELIDVWHAREILSGVSNLDSSLRAPDAEERLVNRFIEYMHNDA